MNLGSHCRDEPDREDCRYERIWEHFATEDDTIYIKIDDDMVSVLFLDSRIFELT
jgi:hypothetical protein